MKVLAWLALSANMLFGLTGCGPPRPDLIKTYEFWTADCGRGTSLFLQDTHGPPIWDQDDFAWGIGYRDHPGGVHWLYNDAETGHPHAPGEPTVEKYVGWDVEGDPSNPGPTFAYTPMPAAAPGRVILFDLGAGLGPPGDFPRDDPPLMNIFIDPIAMTPEEFADVVACLQTHRNDLNAAMVRMRASLPMSPASRFVVLRLGGIAYEKPPFSDKTYMDALVNMRSASKIPAYGPFLLYPGRTATGVIAGHTVRVTAMSTDKGTEARFDVDDAVVVSQPRRPSATNAMDGWSTNVPAATLGFGGLTIEGPACNQSSDNCGKMIGGGGSIEDGAAHLSVMVKTSPYNQYTEYPDWSTESRAARKAAGNCDIAPGC
ncbi:MAG TPA: hypothetical protein VGI95_01035 [Caulobacteraceae bacterium]|jgi:hypothetical protein